MMTQDSQEQPSGSDEIRSLLQNEMLDRVQLLLKMTSSAGLRLQVPNSDIYILAGKADWIASQSAEMVAFGCAQRENIASEIDSLLEEAQTDYEWGGSEDDNGNLQAGNVEFTALRSNVRELLALKGAEAPATAGQSDIELDAARYRFRKEFLENNGAIMWTRTSCQLRRSGELVSFGATEEEAIDAAMARQQSAQLENGGDDAGQE